MALEILSYKADSDVVHQELPDRQSRTEGVIEAGQAAIMEVGTVLGIETANGKYSKFSATASNGVQTAAGILLERVDATLVDVNAVILTRIATVVAQALIWPAGISDGDKATALSSLLVSHQIVSRNGV